MITIITDKQNAAKQIALSLDIDIKNSQEGFYKGRNHTIVWTGGTLVTLANSEEYGKKQLTADDLPFYPDTFHYSVQKQINDKGVFIDRTPAKQLKIIKKLFDECESIIAATEPSEKGELTFRRLYDFLQCNKPFKRLWINALTPKTIREGLKNLHNSALFDNLYAAADKREKAEYLMRINTDFAFSIATGIPNYSPGRLQTLLLAMICKRFIEQRTFSPSRYYELGMTIEKEGLTRKCKILGIFKRKRRAERLFVRLKKWEEIRIAKVGYQIGIQPPPLPYNLLELQKEANRRYDFSAAKTADIVRKLYEEGLISFPFTDARHIPETVFDAIPKHIRHAVVYCGFADALNILEWKNLNRHSVSENQPLEHHAILPTGIVPPYLPKDDKLIFSLIVERTLESLAPNCRKKTTDIEAVCGQVVLTSKVVEISDYGWRLVRNSDENREENEANADAVVPLFSVDENVRIAGWNLITKTTQQPPLFTGSTLLSEMETASLGTVETRAEIINSLITNGFVESWGQNLVPTEKGMSFFLKVKKMQIADKNFIADIERFLQDIESKHDTGNFAQAFGLFFNDATKEILTSYPQKIPSNITEK